MYVNISPTFIDPNAHSVSLQDTPLATKGIYYSMRQYTTMSECGLDCVSSPEHVKVRKTERSDRSSLCQVMSSPASLKSRKIRRMPVFVSITSAPFPLS